MGGGLPSNEVRREEEEDEMEGGCWEMRQMWTLLWRTKPFLGFRGKRKKASRHHG